MVMITAITPSLKASRRLVPILDAAQTHSVARSIDSVRSPQLHIFKHWPNVRPTNSSHHPRRRIQQGGELQSLVIRVEPASPKRFTRLKSSCRCTGGLGDPLR